MKNYATASRGKPSQIVAATAVNVPVEVRVALENLNTVKRTVRNHKKKGASPKQLAGWYAFHQVIGHDILLLGLLLNQSKNTNHR